MPLPPAQASRRSEPSRWHLGHLTQLIDFKRVCAVGYRPAAHNLTPVDVPGRQRPLVPSFILTTQMKWTGPHYESYSPIPWIAMRFADGLRHDRHGE